MRVPLVDLTAQFRPIKQEVMKAIEDVLDEMHLFLGPNTQAFEDEFAAYCNVGKCVTVANGTDALHLALRAAGVVAGDEVITASHSFIATANCIRYCGANPVFVDIDPDTYNIDPARVAEAITPRTRAILAVHQMGMPCDLSALAALTKRHDLILIEDAACAAGSQIRGRNRS